MDKPKKTPSTRRILTHPVEFPQHNSIAVTPENIVEKVHDKLQHYKTREFRIAYLHYGLEASVNYEHGQFQSMIQKGSGLDGERIDDEVALKLVPKENDYKEGKVTIHALLTTKWDSHLVNPSFEKQEIPRIIRSALRKNEITIDGGEIVCRAMRLYVDGKYADLYSDAEELIKDFALIYDLPTDYSQVEDWVKELTNDDDYFLPISGIIIVDEHLDEPEAFPETHFIFA